MVRQTWWMLFFLFCLESWAFGGTGAGNGFLHRVNDDFDFHIAHPASWDFTEGTGHGWSSPCEAPVQCTAWSISNRPLIGGSPKELSSVFVTFMLNAPADDIESLRNWVRTQHEGVESDWPTLEESSFYGVTSGAMKIDDKTWETIDYYLVDRRQVIRVVWRAHVKWKHVIDTITATIDRASTPPKVIRIESEATRVQPGDQACLRIEVDDLRGEFSHSGIELRFVGDLSHFMFKDSIEWNPERNWFRVCVPVRTSYRRDDLHIEELDLQNARGQELSCFRSGSRLVCRDCVNDGRKCRDIPAPFPVQVPQVVNPSPDREGPVIRSLSFDSSTLTLRFDADDATGILGGEVILNHGQSTKVLSPIEAGIFPSHFDLSAASTSGWNTIEGVVLYDLNGFGTLWKHLGGETYLQFDLNGRKSRTDVGVINYFVPTFWSQGRAQ